MTDQTRETEDTEKQAGTAESALDPSNCAALVGGLTDRLARLKIQTSKRSGGSPERGVMIVCKGGGLTQKIALIPDPDPERPSRYQWVWLWSDGLRGEGPTTPEPMCAGEAIETATSAIARVLGVRPVGV